MARSTPMAGKRHPKAPWAPGRADVPHPRAPGRGLKGATALATLAGFQDPETAGRLVRFGRA